MLIKKKQNQLLLLDDYILKNLFLFLPSSDSSEFSAASHRTRKFYYFSYSNTERSKIATDIEKWQYPSIRRNSEEFLLH
jgi:Tol biopolymer transport system component